MHNKLAAPNPAIASRVHVGRPWRGIGEPDRSVAEECSQIQTQERKEKANDNEESNQRKSNH